jgi:HAD superfamily hydrolase (TIGR01549 family)
MINAVIFDAFGTIVRPVPPSGPFWKLAALMPGSSNLLRRHRLLTTVSSFDAVAEAYGLTDALVDASEELRQEIASISFYDDAIDYISSLRFLGYKVAVCSNLAHDYAVRLRELLPETDGVFLSCEIGAIKPEAKMYQAVVDGLGLPAHECLFVGDTPRQDVDGPREFGMRSLLIERNHRAASISVQVDAALKVLG